MKATLSAVTNGDADAAVVYVTDAQTVTSSQGTSVSIPDAENVIAVYEIAQVKGAKNPSVAQAWIAYVVGPDRAVGAQGGRIPAHRLTRVIMGL